MPAIELPNGQSAVIAKRGEISERASRKIEEAQLRSIAVSAKLIKAGLDTSKPETFAVYDELPQDDTDKIRALESVLIVNFVKSWTLGELPTMDSVLDLDHETFELLANECLQEFTKFPDFSQDAHEDPLADGVSSDA